MSLHKLMTAVVFAAGTMMMASAEPTAAKQTLDGITLPSDGQARELKFETQGTLLEVKVKPGQHVKAGEIVALQDDRKEQTELAGLIADSTQIEIEKARVASDEKAAAFKRITKLHEEAGNDAEYEEAKAQAEYAKLDITSKERELDVKNSKVEHQRIIIDMMKLRSPVDGYVLSIDTNKGEIADPHKPVMKIVANDPLQVEIHAPTAVSQRLKLGQEIKVSYDEKQWFTSTVSFISPQADQGVGYQKVWLQLPNKEQHHDSGLKIVVEVPGEIANAVAAEASAAGK